MTDFTPLRLGRQWKEGVAAKLEVGLSLRYFQRLALSCFVSARALCLVVINPSTFGPGCTVPCCAAWAPLHQAHAHRATACSCDDRLHCATMCCAVQVLFHEADAQIAVFHSGCSTL